MVSEALPQPPTTSEDIWGSGFNEEFDVIKGFKVGTERETTPNSEVVVTEDNDITEEDEESNTIPNPCQAYYK